MANYSTLIEPVKLVAAVLYSSESELKTAYCLLESTFSKIDFQGESFSFEESDYYQSEMGKGLFRKMISFEELVSPDFLADAKHLTHFLENELANDGFRKINIDIGYLDLFKFVLASFKSRSNKIYLGKNIWADMILYFESATYQPFIWSFPDFKSGKYNKDLIAIRNRFKPQLKSWLKNENEAY